eukprot:181739-Chlamydomonas_euryale.AAC.6
MRGDGKPARPHTRLASADAAARRCRCQPQGPGLHVEDDKRRWPQRVSGEMIWEQRGVSGGDDVDAAAGLQQGYAVVSIHKHGRSSFVPPPRPQLHAAPRLTAALRLCDLNKPSEPVPMRKWPTRRCIHRVACAGQEGPMRMPGCPRTL